MVFNKKDLSKAFSPTKVKRIVKKRSLGNGTMKPSTSGSTVKSEKSESGSQTNIKVIVRVRPHNEKEMQTNCKDVIKIVDDRMLIFDPKEKENPFFYQGIAQKGRDLLKKQNKELQFIFDTVFDACSNNKDVFEGSTKDLIRSLLDGYNCSVFAYGATGAGKTHTMLGSITDPGITYRTMAELFSQIEQQGENREFNLGVTYLEIYNENVQDLLHISGPLPLREDSKCGVIVAGLKIIKIQNADDLLTLLAKGNRNRTQHPTDANAESSRSHAVFQVYINITNKLDGQVQRVKLSMIDLAGSERASATGCKGARFKEGANINKSLLALGNCINNLADGTRHVGYRDSKLTRLLKDSLGGNCQTVMIANIAPTSFTYEDTYNTLRYANRAKKIKTNVKKNVLSCEMHVTTYIKMVEEQKKEIDFLKRKLLSLENGPIAGPSEPKISKTRDKVDKCIPAMKNKLIALTEKKKALNEKVLFLESADKILCCRIQYKKAADERLHNLTAAVESLPSEEQNASGKTRVNKSMHYFERQREVLKKQLLAVWTEICTVETDLQKLDTEIKSKDLAEHLKDVIALQSCEIENSRAQQQFEHAKKISNLQQCEMRSLYSMIKMMSTTLQDYYNTIVAHGTMPDKTKQEFKQLVKLLEGVRNIKWSDIETLDEEEHFYNLTCLSVPQLSDPLNNTAPIYAPSTTDNDYQDNCNKEILNTTFDASTTKIEENFSEVLHNTTITLTEKPENNPSKEVNSASNEGFGNGIIHLEQAKKRALSDKNQSNRTPPAKARKISPKQITLTSTIGTTGKENKQTFKPIVGMTAKSIAVLNKLKADRFKKDSFDSEKSDGTLKIVRDKERRGLMTAHPYLKPNIGKQKFVRAPASSRVPW